MIKIRLRSMVILLAIIPLILSLLAIIFIIRQNSIQLAERQIQAIKPLLIQYHKKELKNFVKIARRSIVISDDRSANVAVEKKAALELLRRMDFGDDNYLYVYDTKGVSLMHPRLKDLEGKNQWKLQDGAGKPVIQGLIYAALAGDGYMEYMWNRPSTGVEESKLGYVELIPEWGWIIGTGLYLDDLQGAMELISRASTAAAQKTLNQILLVALVGLIFVAAGGGGLGLYEQRSANKKLRAMARNVVLSSEIERSRVARELHDGVIQTLASVKFMFETSLLKLEQKADGAESSLREGLAQMRKLMADVRGISHGLRPLILSDLGLESAIKQIIREFSGRTNIPVTAKILPIPGISDSMGTEIFRLIQQALGNIEVHAEATQVSIHLGFTSDGLTVQIKDNGIGFNVKETIEGVRAGHGLTNMRERVEMLGGRFKITSRPGETLIEANLDESIIKA